MQSAKTWQACRFCVGCCAEKNTMNDANPEKKTLIEIIYTYVFPPEFFYGKLLGSADWTGKTLAIYIPAGTACAIWNGQVQANLLRRGQVDGWSGRGWKFLLLFSCFFVAVFIRGTVNCGCISTRVWHVPFRCVCCWFNVVIVLHEGLRPGEKRNKMITKNGWLPTRTILPTGAY